MMDKLGMRMLYIIFICLYQGNQTRVQKQKNVVLLVSNNIMDEYKISNWTKYRGIVEFIMEKHIVQ